ncbi:hypothetical protein TRVL_08196 [Trypanosoma vivax]|nr:hypothetical protein TRVL_08196 [Trypanosoma vivax]
MVLDSATEERRQHCNQGDRTARSEAGRETISNSGRGCANFRRASDGAGKRSANAQAIEGIRKRHSHNKAPNRDPCLLAWASEANRVAEGVLAGTAWEQRMSIMRRFGEFTKERGLEMSEGHVPLFIVRLNLAKSGAGRYTRALASPMATGKAPAQMFLSGLRGAAGYSKKQSRPMVRWRLGLVCPALLCGSRGSRRDAVAKLRCC